MFNSTYAARGERGLAIVVNFITVQGEEGSKKAKTCVRTMYGPQLFGLKVCYEKAFSNMYYLQKAWFTGNRT